MLDRFNREISYLRISVTDRCNLRCTYCMPPEGVISKRHDEILSFEEILEIVKESVNMGFSKIRLTGGEPLVRKGIIPFIENLTKIKGVQDIGLTTNGILLSQMAKDLKKAGLNRLNISLDTLNPEKYHKITRIGNINDVLEGIDTAIEEGFDPIKINCVKIPKENDNDILSLIAFCQQKKLELRFIRQMNLNAGEFYPVEGGAGGRCSICNRLRLTSDGFIKPCLFSDFGFNVRKLGIKEAFDKAIDNKPLKGGKATIHEFYNIGG